MPAAPVPEFVNCANSVVLALATSNNCAGLVVPMPTLPSIINPPVGAAVVSYPAPKLPPPETESLDPGATSPIPTLPSVNLIHSVALLLIVHAKYSPVSFELVSESNNTEAELDNNEAGPEPVKIMFPKTSNFAAGTVAPMPTLPSDFILNLSVMVPLAGFVDIA